MSFRLTFLLIGSLFFQIANGQANYLPGHIITLDSDTLKGFIDYRNWDKNPDNISFVTVIGDPGKMYRPLQIESFQVNNEIYLSEIVETETSPKDTERLNSFFELNIRIDTTFLRTLVDGPKSLYYYKNNLGIENFYIRENNIVQLLAYKKYRKSIDSKIAVAENRGYVGQLSTYLKNCSPGTDAIRKTAYDNPDLIKLFEAYYNCKGSSPFYLSTKEKMQPEFGFIAGTSISTLVFTGEEFDYLVNTNYSNSVNFSGGLSLNIVIPRSLGRWSIYNELLFTSYKVTGSNIEEIREDYYNEHVSTIARSYLKLNNLIRYKYPLGENFIFINIGISNGFAISESGDFVYQQVFFDQVRPLTSYALENTRSYEQGLIGGMGFQMKRFSIDLRYEKGNGISDVSNLKSSSKRIYFLVGYRF